MNAPYPIPQLRRTTQACDACKLRKVKCNGQTRCQQCSHLNLHCVYSEPKPRKKSLRRGQLIAQYKQNTSLGSKDKGFVKEHRQTTPPVQGKQTLPAITTLLSKSPTGTSSLSPSHDAEFFSSFLEDYEISVYPVNPIITVAEMQASIADMLVDTEARALIYAYVAVTTMLTQCAPEIEAETASKVAYWTKEAAQARGTMLPHSKASVRKIMTCQFLHICLMGLGNTDMAFFALRESITMIQMLRIDDPRVMGLLSLPERGRRQRLYGEAFIHERYLAIADYRTTVLPPLPNLPEYDPSVPLRIHEGFIQLIRLFTLIDGEFVTNWLGSHAGESPVTADWVERKQKQIDSEPAGSDDEVARLTDMQQADIIITKHWLRTLVWQMAMSKCLLSSAPSKESMSLLFPVRLSSQLRSLVGKISRQAIEIHGCGIQQKLFELTDTIANVVITVPAATVEETAGRVEDFMFLINFLFSMRNFDPLQRDILQKKLETLQSMFPHTANTPDSTITARSVQENPLASSEAWVGSRIPIQERTNSEEYPSPHIQSSPPSLSTLMQQQQQQHQQHQQHQQQQQQPKQPKQQQQNGQYHQQYQYPQEQQHKKQPPTRVWRDVTRLLSMAPANSKTPCAGLQGFEPH